MYTKKYLFIIFLFIFHLFLYKAVKAEEYVLGEVLIKFKNGVPNTVVQEIFGKNNLTVSSTVSGVGAYLLSLPQGKTVTGVISALSKNPHIEYAEPNYIYHASLTRPNDPLFGQQWHLENTGQTLGCDSDNSCADTPTGTAGSDIEAVTGWNTQTGVTTVTIAIIDTGVDLDHPDLINNIVSGFDFVNNDSLADDDHGHGTHVAGIAAAEADNAIGVSGVCWRCKIMPVKVLGDTGSGTSADIASGIDFAVLNGAKVINLSLGGSTASATLANALKDAYDNNVISVCAAGNDAGSVSFPAANDEYCIAVAATTNKDLLSSFSNFGNEIDVAAPGTDIYSTHWVGGGALGTSTTCKEDTNNLGYGFCSGTSMASPLVAGLAALIVSEHSDYNPDQVLFRMMQAAEDVNSAGFDVFMGAGRVTVNPLTITSSSVEADDDSGPCFISSIRE